MLQEKLIYFRLKMKLYQKLIIPVLSLALLYSPGCREPNKGSRSSGGSGRGGVRSPTGVNLISMYAGTKTGQASILYFAANPPNAQLEIKVNDEELPLGIPSGDFCEGLGTYNYLESLDAKGRPTGKGVLSLTAVRPCTLRVEGSQLPAGDSSFAATLPYSGNPIISTTEIKAMAKAALYSGGAPEIASGSAEPGSENRNSKGGWFSSNPLQSWLNDVSRREQRRARPGSTSARESQSLQQYLGDVSRRDSRRAR